MAETTAVPSDQRLRALAFYGGGFDAAMHLGVVHALLVTRGKAPDYVAGLSAGAVTAAALAEILKAGEDRSDRERRDMQVDSLRRFLNAFQEVPKELLFSLLPDTYEINATRPLLPVELPIHFKAERDGRDDANKTRAGLIRIMNRLLKVQLTVSAAAVIINRVLRFVAASEEVSRWQRIRERVWHATFLWFLGYRHMVVIAPTVRSLLWAAMVGRLAKDPKKVGGSAGKLIGQFVRIRQGASWALDLLSVIVFELVWILLVPPIALATSLRVYLRRTNRQRAQWGRQVLDRILEHYEIADGLGSTYVLKQQLIRCFDPNYHGKPDMATILDKALDYSKDGAPSGDEKPETLAKYSSGRQQIVVAPMAAEVSTGELRVLPGDVPIVDALLAATAMVPVFPAVPITCRFDEKDSLSEKFFIDGENVSGEPIGALVKLLREDERLDKAAVVDIYPVSNLAPDTNGGNPREECSGILEVAARALDLQRFRDATIEQRLTQLYTKALPAHGSARITIGKKTYVRAEVRALGLERPAGVNREIFLGKSNLGLRELIYEAVADGCRAAIEAMIPEAIAEAGIGAPDVKCLKVVEYHLKKNGLPSEGLPGSAAGAPGLAEICRHCALFRPRDSPETNGKENEEKELKKKEKKQYVKFREDRQHWPEWPVEGAVNAVEVVSELTDSLSPKIELPNWPHDRGSESGGSRPLVNFLFGGGVFRGVFHMGVMNALNELGLQPDLVAGSSVGSIIAAMIAQTFNEKPNERHGQIANLAATFLSIDQLVMTDRLADFVRGLTLRAADSPFSPRDLDLVLRRYDFDPSGGWSDRTRRVVGGLERLFYLSPMRLSELVKAARERDIQSFRSTLLAAVQDFLDRGGVGQEVLGTEPLALLIYQEVIQRFGGSASEALFDAFRDSGIHFLATATNLSRGRLDILGSPEPMEPSEPPAKVSLLYGLLASSAFPGVFRPRQAWEVFRSATRMDQYIDGGTMDNLPLDAVARFLDRVSRGPNTLVARRPKVGGQEVPHLLFTASLEVDKTSLPDDKAARISKSFLQLRSRAGTFRYNRKIDAYASVQRDLREIYHSRVQDERGTVSWSPLDLHVIAVRPRWLCNTFGFHPMLGFRRKRQAESIAHGCASTIATLYHESRQPGADAWMDAWGVRGLDAIDDRAVTSQRQKDPSDKTKLGLNPRSEGKKPGDCWFRNGKPCPFSSEALKTHEDLAKREPLIQELTKIYAACGKPETHRPAHAVHETVE
jgi:predicted acylesterase/phospholipase RssA